MYRMVALGYLLVIESTLDRGRAVHGRLAAEWRELATTLWKANSGATNWWSIWASLHLLQKHIPQSAVCNLLRLIQSESCGSCLQKSRGHSNFHNGLPPISGTTINFTAQLNILCTRYLCSLYLIPVYQYTSSPGPSQSGQVPSFDSHFMSSLLSNWEIMSKTN
jgi:hypothetical protein